MKAKEISLTLTLLSASLLNSISQPVITTEPQSQTNVVGADATFTVVATGTEPFAYQWRLSTAALAGKTNDTLIVTNVQTANAGGYTVVITNVEGAVTSAVATLTVLVPPAITRQPTNQSVSLGANVTFSATAAGTPTRYFQWRFNETNLPGKTSTSLVVTNVQLTNAGDYTVVVTNTGGSVTSQVAHLAVDLTFTKITTGQIVNDGGYGFGCAWGDYNNDGFIDLLVCNQTPPDFLYRNNGDGTFTRITTGPLVSSGQWGIGAAWGDYDNDGNLDIFVTGPAADGSSFGPNGLYHNNGNGTFTKITTGLLVTQPLYSHAGVWADFDNDGLIDIFVVNFSDLGSTVAPQDNYLYRNKGGATFDRISFGTKSLTNGHSWNVAAADFNNDGWIDLFVPQGGTQTRQNNLLYANSHDGSFTLQTNSNVFTDGGNSVACAWGDYDNDGFLDLFVSNFYGQNNFLYHNNGDGTLTSITNSPVTLDGGASVGCAWGDYDNDGWLDLFVANLGPVNSNAVPSIGPPENNFLYRNNGDGTFAKITAGSLVNDLGYSTGCAWGDYDNDGFLDLFVSNGWVTQSENNFLYRNNGNSNNWITFKLVGTLSNRAAIGAKVRVKATIGGNTIWQMREISGGSNYGSQDDMRPSFGLGDATNVDLVQIEWPSGIVQTMTTVAAKRFLEVVEQQVPGGVIAPGSTRVSRSASGVVDLSVTGNAGLLYLFETSTNLVNWSWLGVRSNATGTVEFVDPRATNFTKRFYRVSVP